MSLLTANQPSRLRESGGVASVAGIDLGSYAAKVVLVTETREQRSIVAAARVPLPAEFAEDPVRQAATLGQWLCNWCAFSAESTACSLPSQFTDYEATPSNALQDASEDMAASVLETTLGDAAADATYDCWRTPAVVCDGADETLHVVWTANDVALDVSRELARWGLACRVLEPAESALARVPQEPRQGEQLVVDLGRETATFVLSDAGAAKYVRHRVALSTGGATARLAEAMGTPLGAAETMLAEWGCDPAAGPLALRVADAIDGWLRELHFELNRTLAYLDLGRSGQGLEKIVLCGGGSEVRGLAAWLAARLAKPVVTAAAPVAAAWNAAEPYSPIYAQAAALALGEGQA